MSKKFHHNRALYNKMDLDPDSLNVRLNDEGKSLPHLFKDNVLQLDKLFQYFIKTVGNAVSEIIGDHGPFQAENGVTIEMDLGVCRLPDCMEEDEIQKIHRSTKYVLYHSYIFGNKIIFSANANTQFLQSA